jgi:fatty acid desaturase
MEQKINWYRTPIDRGLLKKLTNRSDVKGLLQAGSILFLYIVTVYFSYYFFAQRLWVPMVAVCYAHCMFHGFVGMQAAVHELSHGTPFKSKWANEIFYHLFCFLSWNNAVHFRVSHMKHHQYTLHKGLDKEVVLEPIDFTRLNYASWFFFDANWFKIIMFPNIAHFFGKADVDFFFWDPLFSPEDKKRKQMCNYARFMVIGHLILLGVFIYFQLWILIFVVTFGYFFATFPTRGCVIQQHLGLRSNVPDWRVSCHTVKFGPLMEYLYWHMNYHTEHHMFAAVPFHNLRKLHKAIAFDTPKPLKGYLMGIKRILTIQKRQRRDSNYCFVPAFPSTAAPPRIPS